MPSSVQSSVPSSDSRKKLLKPFRVLSKLRSRSKSRKGALETREGSFRTISTKSSEAPEAMFRRHADTTVLYSNTSPDRHDASQSVSCAASHNDGHVGSQADSHTASRTESHAASRTSSHAASRTSSHSASRDSNSSRRTTQSGMSTGNVRYRHEQILSEPPPARKAAFSGPPRFDWIDIETAAAIKIQSIYRRNQVMTMLDERGVTTSAIRNRRRRRKAAERSGRYLTSQSEDAPSFFQWCGVGLAFGDHIEQTEDVYRDYQKARYEERQKQQAMHEEALRKRFLRTRTTGNIKESVEVVE